jgi:hypothetical protein
LALLRRDAKPTQTPVGTGLPFIFQIVLLLLLPLALVYLATVVALLIDLMRSDRDADPSGHPVAERNGSDSKPHIGNFSQ